MESRLFETDLLTGHEPENRKSLEINEAILRFMESPLFGTELLTAHEPGSEDKRERPSPRPSPARGRGRKHPVVFVGLGLGLAGMEGDALGGEVWPHRRG